jgi:hypothetical protein
MQSSKPRCDLIPSLGIFLQHQPGDQLALLIWGSPRRFHLAGAAAPR